MINLIRPSNQSVELLEWNLPSSINDFERRFEEWIKNSSKDTFYEFQERCNHVDTQVQEVVQILGGGCGIRAICKTCLSTTLCLLDDWIANRTRLARKLKFRNRCLVQVKPCSGIARWQISTIKFIDACDCFSCTESRCEKNGY